MKNLITIDKNNLYSITIYNIIWVRGIFDSNLKDKITLKFEGLIGFDINKYNTHFYYLEFIKNYFDDKDKDLYIDDFSYYVTGKDGFNYISDETNSKDDNSLNVNKKNSFN